MGFALVIFKKCDKLPYVKIDVNNWPRKGEKGIRLDMNGKVSGAPEIWGEALSVIKKEVSETAYKQFFEIIVPLGMDNGNLQLGVSDDFFADWLTNNYADVLTEAITEAAPGMGFTLISGYTPDMAPVAKKEVTEEKKESSPPKAAAPVKSAAQVKVPALPAPSAGNEVPEEICFCRPDFTFENYIVGEENKYAYSAAMTAAQNQGVFNPLYIYGGTGMGKTHLMQAVAHEVRKSNPSAIVRYVTCEAFLNAYLDSLHHKSRFHSHFEFRNHFREVDVLLIDDVHQLAGKEQLQEEFFNTFNTLHNANKQIILTSDKRPSEIPGLEARLVTRFDSGLTTQITMPTFETRLSILRHSQELQSIKFSAVILEYVAERVTSSIRSLKAALTRLIAFSSLTHKEVSLTMAEELLGDMLEKEAENARVSIEGIQKMVADHFGIRVPDITGNKRPRNIAEPRMIAMYLARQMTDHSLVEIGAAFGGRNHATVLHAVNSVQADAKENEEFRRTLSTLKRKLKG